jgi:hypothetical protein
MRVESPLVFAIGRLQRVAPNAEASRPEPLRGLRGSEDGVRVSLSPQAREAAGAAIPGREPAEAAQRPTSESGAAQDLSQEEKRRVTELAKRDREVRAHEAAHKGAAGGLAGGASFSYETGPDGKRYAVAGEVSIDTSPVKGDPAATERKMRQVQRAALAPAEPSSQDRKVAASAAAKAQAAQVEQVKQADEASTLGSSGVAAEPAAHSARPEKHEATACPQCGGHGHGPEAHSNPVSTFA